MTEYVVYTGTLVETVSLWRREDDKEYPIYANTRGQCEWFSFDVDTFENTEPNTLSDELVTWLSEYYARIQGVAETTPKTEMPELKYYEREILNAIDDPTITDEQWELMEWAFNKESDSE